jgi:hypothetical protein
MAFSWIPQVVSQRWDQYSPLDMGEEDTETPSVMSLEKDQPGKMNKLVRHFVSAVRILVLIAVGFTFGALSISMHMFPKQPENWPSASRLSPVPDCENSLPAKSIILKQSTC